jgi:hypothetical protein
MLEFSKEGLSYFGDRALLVSAAYPAWNNHNIHLYSQLQDCLSLEGIKDKLISLNWQEVSCKYYQRLIIQLKPDSAVPAEIRLQENLIRYQLQKHTNVEYQIKYDQKLNQFSYTLPEREEAFNQHCTFLFSLGFDASLTIRNLGYINEGTLNRLQEVILERLERHLGGNLEALYLILAS